jgi:hypothetical protein
MVTVFVGCWTPYAIMSLATLLGFIHVRFYIIYFVWLFIHLFCLFYISGGQEYVGY